MRWKGGRRSDNIDDRRGQAPAMGGAAAAPIVMRLLPTLLRTRIGRMLLIGGVVVIVGGKMLGVDVLSLFTGAGMSAGPAVTQGQAGAGLSAEQQEMADFTSVVLADTEDTWRKNFQPVRPQL